MTTPPTKADIRDALSRAAASDPLRNAPQLVSFLSFVVEKTLAGEANSVKGYTIATEALGRRQDFDPQTDPIVRVEAGRLRRTLDAYYNGSGSADPLRIVIPRGTYVPQFVPVASTSMLGAEAEAGATPHAEPPPNPGAERSAEFEAEVLRAVSSELDTGDTAAPTLPVANRVPPDTGPTWARIAAGRCWRTVAAVTLIVAAILAVLTALHFNDTGWIARAVRAPLARSLATPGGTDGRPVVVVGPVESFSSGVGTAPPAIAQLAALRSLVLDRLARFDEVSVVDGAASRPENDRERYVLVFGAPASGSRGEVLARLTHEPSGEVVWARTFEASPPGGDASPEADVARQVALALGQPYGVIFADQRARPGRTKHVSCMLTVFEHRSDPSAEKQRKVRACLEAWLAVEPHSALALAGLASLNLEDYRAGSAAPQDSIDRAYALARRAVAVAPDSARAHQALMAVLFARGERGEALRIGRVAHDLNPCDTDIMADLGARLIQAGRYADGAALIDRAASENPAHPSWYSFYRFVAAFMQDDWGTARAAAGRITAPNFIMGLMAKAIVAVNDGQVSEAKTLVTRMVALQPEYARDAPAVLARRNFLPEIEVRLLNALRQAGLRSAS